LIADCCSRTDVVPSGEDLERFFSTIVSRVRPKSLLVPSYTWLKGGIGFTIANCIFHCRKFTLSPHERSRLQALPEVLLQEGKLSQAPSRERKWVGAVDVRRLISSLFHQACKEGTKSWDITIAQCLSIVLVAATGARIGDVTTASSDRHPLPFLAYRDIVIRMRGGDTIDDLEAIFTLRNEKGNKYVESPP
jgi:hypothetical protein